MSAPKKPPFRDAADLVAEALDGDVLFINAPIYRPLDAKISELCRARRRRKNVALILVTTGGDADAAYRIARCLQERYERLMVYVTGYCKSAGTLIAIGAHELIIADTGELGPLDVQMSKPDELLQRQSGLTATAALSTLHEQAYQAFEHFFLNLVAKSGSAISTRTATQIAVQLTSGLFAPMYGHVDPMHVGEAGRALMVAEQYGQLLDAHASNLSSGALSRLTTGYASHEFVIDRAHAKTLFRRVRAPHNNEQILADLLGPSAATPMSSTDRLFMAYLSSELPEPQDQVIPGLVTDSSYVQTDTDSHQATTGEPIAGGAASAGIAGETSEAHITTIGSVRAAGGGRHSRAS